MFLYLLTICYTQASLQISLETKWKTYSESSLKQEISEFFSEYSSFWNFLDQDLSVSAESLIDSLATPLEKSLLMYSLHNREFSSRLEFYSKLEQEHNSPCRPFFVINNIHSCDLDQVLAKYPSTLNNTFDHLYRIGEGHIILYADITDTNFRTLNKNTQAFAEQHNLTYALRHLDLRIEGQDFIGGFGAELTMKNMEYNPTENLNFNYVPLEKWETEGICKKVVSFLTNLDELSQVNAFFSSIPDFIPEIIDRTVEKSLEKELEKLSFSHVVGNTLLINNQEVQPSVFEVLKVLRNEVQSSKNLQAIGISEEQASKIQSISNLNLRSYQNKAKAVKMTLSTGRVYLNDLENDEKYDDFPKSPEEFLFSYGAEIPPIALNFFNLILICDVNEEYCFQALANLMAMMEEMLIHVGVIFTGNQDLSTILLEGVRNLKKMDEDLPFEFLQTIKYGMSPEEAERILNEMCPDCDLNLEYSYMGKRCQEFCDNVGLCGPAEVVLNGRVLDFTEVDLASYEEFKENLHYELLKEKRTVTALAMRGYLEPPLESFFEKVKYMNTTERVNFAISAVSTAKIEIAEGVPRSSVGWDAQNPQGFFYIVLSKDDLGVIRTVLDFKDRSSDLNLVVKVLFAFDTLDSEWEQALQMLPGFEKARWGELVGEHKEVIRQLNLCASCVIVNSRVIKSKHFKNYRDFYIALEAETSRLNTPQLISSLKDSDLLEKAINQILRNSKLAKNTQSYKTAPIPAFLKQSPLTRSYSSGKATFEVQAVANIDSTEASKVINICAWLSELGASVTISYVSSSADSKFPLRTYSKYLIKNSFDENLEMRFNQSHTYSLNLDVPDTWMVRPVKSSKDLDNLHVTDSETVKFAIKSLLVQGQCSQTMHGMHLEPPNGLQLTLSDNNAVIADTIVMKNFGYFQFQASPGTFKINLAEGRSSLIFDIAQGGETSVKDLVGGMSLMSVSKKRGFEKEELLEVTEIDNGETIHVFSLASGKLYERLIKIMITSVMKFTKSKVKFWLLEDFFSPNFSEGIEVLAKDLGFEYELLSYKWPSWLYKQTEKQRIIWSYKILFLDVLFPLKVNRIIYIDADQVVRADIKELWEMDLQGAPYAYTPFCESNPLTEKFMFWKGGYWKNHLKDLPYHISALYVVDLNVFRGLGAGDILRYFYETLAPSPDSLSNLDQDLPNFAQTHLKIFSLPQEWLWCASWCSEESQKFAKSIDLCNNPLTREHKIEAAKKYIPEWQEYDYYVSNLTLLK